MSAISLLKSRSAKTRAVLRYPSNRAAYVTNAISGTVSVVDLNRHTQVAEIPVGTEPRGCALTADGSLLYVANLTEGTVSIIVTSDPLNPISDGAVTVGGRPWAVAITDKGTGNISDDTVFVTDAFAEVIPNFSDPTFDGNGEARDQGKQGVVHAFPAGKGNPPITKITLAPLANSGFTANRIAPNNFCGAAAHSLIFCPDPNDINDPINVADPQGVFPNQLTSGLIRGNRLYLPNIGAQPEPPVIFNVNVQALVYNVDVNALSEVPAEHVNLNNQIKVETAQPPPSLDRTFGNDIVAIDGNSAGDTFLIVSRGGNQVFRAIRGESGQLNILNAAGTRVDCRLQTGNLPNGVAMRKDGTRGYANNEANFSVTTMDTNNCLTLQLDIASSEPPAPGSFQHAVLVGKLAFFTALGIPDNDIFGTPIRDFIPRNFKGKQAEDAWSTCGSCHNDGLGDGVTWIFAGGPRRTKPMDGMFSKQNPDDQDLLNWSATRDSNTDFNNSALSRAAADSPAIISIPGNVSSRAMRRWPTRPSTTTASHRGAVTRSTRRPCLSSLECGRSTNQSPPIRQPERRCSQRIVPPVTAGPSGRRVRSSIATTRQRWLRTGLHWTPASPVCPVASGSGSAGERVLLVHLQQPHHQISRGCGDVRPQRSFGDPRRRRRQHAVWEEWVQRAVVA